MRANAVPKFPSPKIAIRLTPFPLISTTLAGLYHDGPGTLAPFCAMFSANKV
tara:strand:- start:293 stop:448 length:156 start_codon:yes stop_codon:yes gene_type:complete